MNVAGLIFLLFAHYFTGKGALRLIGVRLDPIADFCFSMIVGVPLLSFAPCIVQLLNIRLTIKSISIAVLVFTLIFSIPSVIKFRRPRFQKVAWPKLYEWPFILVFLYFILLSVWRCFYMPPFSRDMLAGPELLAEFAVREKNMISSVFTVDLSTSNNYFKSPYITCLQIIYKLLVSSFGQLWLSILFLSFTTWIAMLIRKQLHPFIACVLLLFFITIPEMWAYTFIILYDYSNMIFFFSGFYFLATYFEDNRTVNFAFSVFLFGLATYIRTESLILILMLTPLLLLHFYRNKLPVAIAASRLAIFGLVPALFWYVCIHVFVARFVPIPFVLKDSVNPHLADITPFFDRLSDMWSKLLFSDFGIGYYGWYVYLFCFVLIVDVLWPRKFNRMSLYALYGVAVIYIGLAFIGYLLPLADLQNTTKRGMFKAFPLMLLYMANSGILLYISGKIKQWELPKPVVVKKKPVEVKAPVAKKKIK
jgi:hypothetical protein